MRHFFTLFIIFALFSFSVKATDNTAQPLSFEQIQSIIDSNRFEMVFTIATTHYSYYLQPTTPYSDQNIRIEKDSAFIIVNGTLAAGYLPYFSGGYSFPQIGIKGILFHNKMLNKTVKTRGHGKNQAIRYEFEVIGANDNYKLNIDIQYDGTCYLYVNSSRRSPISYVGKIIRLKPHPF